MLFNLEIVEIFRAVRFMDCGAREKLVSFEIKRSFNKKMMKKGYSLNEDRLQDSSTMISCSLGTTNKTNN